MPFAKSESNHDLLKLPDHSSARMITEFTLSDNKNTNTNTNTNTNKNNENGMFNVDMGLPSIGGGLIVVNNYGDYPISVGSLTLGQLGSTWKDKETAIDALCDEVDSTSEKCTATDLQIGGCGVLLYLLPNQQDTLEARQRLLKALGNEITNLVNTNVLCIPGPGIHQDDITFLHKTNSKVQVQVDHHHHHGNANANANANGDSDEEKKEGTAVAAAAAAASPSSTKGRRSRSLSIASEDFDYPIPLDLVTNPTILTDHAAHSAMGAVLALAKDKKWQTCHILLVGLTPISITMYRLLIERGYEVYMSVNPNTTDTTSSSIIPDDVTKLVPWEEAQRYRCDIMIPCTAEFPKLDPQFIEQNLRCHNIVSINHNLLPQNFKLREDTHVMLEEHGIFDFCDGLLDLGAIAKLYHLSQKTTFTSKDAMAMGSRMMGKSLHLAKIVQQYDVEEKHNFYKIVLNRMDDESTRSDSLNLGLGTMIHNSSSRMTEWMWSKAKVMCPAYRALQSITVKRNMKKDVYYLDLGSGTGAAARSICSQDSHIHFKCINICPKQNAENRQLSDEAGLGGQVSVDTVTFERLPSEYSNAFDGCIAQDSFFHAFSKLKAFSEAYKVTKGGGWIMVSDLMCGEGEHVSDDELKSFAEKNNIKSWFSQSQCVELAKQAGWVDVQFIDCTPQIKVSLKSLLDQIKSIIEARRLKGFDLKLLQTHRISLVNRIGQADRGVFKWGIIAARKPYDVVFMSEPPVTPDAANTMMNYSTNLLDGDLKYGTDVVILNISDRMPREAIMRLPSTVRLIVTMSAGLDHISMDAAKERGIRVRRAARDQIVKSVADYLLSNIIFGLRNGFQNVGVPFPGKAWNLSWNADGVDLDRSKIGFIGMGAIAVETARRLRALSKDCVMVFHIPEGIRCHFEEGTFRMDHVGIADLYSTCNVVIPMVPLTPTTANLVDYSAFSMMDNKALFINMARGKVVDTEGLTRALKEGIIKHAILDTTEPEPLPRSHDLWTLTNCTITPHFATNTIYVREELVEDIPNQVEDTLEERGILRLEEQKMRKELSEAYRITREFGMDELVWNHISVLLSDGTYLITPGNRLFDDISAQDLVKSGGSGNVTADIIHEAVYKVRPDVRAIVHLHTPATVAVSCLEMGFQPLAQEAAPFVGRVASYPWHGVSNDWQEQKMIGEAVADVNFNTLVMENHGFCTFGKTLGEAWVLAYYFDKACQTQLNCLQSGAKIRYPNPQVLAHAAQQATLPEFLPGACEWEALRKMLERKSKRW